MKKILLGALFLFGIVALMSNVQATGGIEFVTPGDGDFISGEDYIVEWTNDDNKPDFWLQYRTDEGNWQNLANIEDPSEETIFEWDTTDLEDGVYHLRLIDEDTIYDTVNFTIDNTDPSAGIEIDQDGFENDEMTDETKTSITISTDEENSIVFCEIDWDDGSTTNCLFNPPFDNEFDHQYADNGDYEIVLTIEDQAGNMDETSAEADVENVAPECQRIDGPIETAVGFEVEFTGTATDVDADQESLDYFWTFGDSNSEEENPARHIYEEAGDYEVNLEVEDKDGGTVDCAPLQIMVAETLELTEQEVAAYYNLNANFGENKNAFDTGLEGDVTCEIISESPSENLEITGVGNDCVVEWGDKTGARATNDERGPYTIIVKAMEKESEEVAYFQFDLTVYSWIIPLYADASEEGWNLISIPLVPTDNSIETVILDQIFDQLPGGTEHVVWSYQYNPSTEMSEWVSSRRSGFGDLDTINPGYGYWIRVLEDTEIKGFGTKVAPGPGVPPQVKVLANGWALIGRYGILDEDTYNNENGRKIAGFLGKLNALQSVFRESFNSINLYDADGDGNIWRLEELNHYEGFWLQVENNGNNNPQEEIYTPLDDLYTKN